ncbi:NAD(P)H-dependent oxidoreductase [Achromobacter sp. SD115]|uniref:Flavodoxin-like fold family protein n=1 Tax=Achromobacter xylosoxidans (strain A8) TaxID=762376 RepID=E3HH99_ACHXA|nr:MULTISPECIES: NAD(P)H-dependent oxidoreductase [Achromobacter]ADP19049.1 flavodoxin-like fold family protein [Achromobacter xylosoxidans A8]MBO1015839.1 NAD(P)H-dependent oxidoreductase [Achromobacter sp. SD115]
MNILVITAGAPADTFSAALAERYVNGVQSGGHARVIWADLRAEAFDPRMTEADLDFYRGKGPLPGDVRREQLRVEAADLVVLAFPIYWWAMPALAKGWIDRVFTKGWAFGAAGGQPGRLAGKRVRLIATGGAGPHAYDEYGYRAAISTQIEHGILYYSGVSDLRTHLFLDVESGDEDARHRNLSDAYGFGLSLAATGAGTPPAR